MRIALIGGVQSSTVALNALLRHEANIVGVLGYVPGRATNVSGYVDVVAHAQGAGLANALPFTSVNSPEVVQTLASWDIDVLMVVGLSQIVSPAVRATAKQLAVGFHPTQLPVGRGRAPIAWLVLRGGPGAATLFELTDAADEGDILVQVPYEVNEQDHAADVVERCMVALETAIADFMQQVAQRQWRRRPQSERGATYWGRRTPEDGRIDWTEPAVEVDRLVRASSHPHPGAYTVTPQGAKIVFARSKGVFPRHVGVPGRILEKRQDGWLIACRAGAVLLTGIRLEPGSCSEPRVGDSVSVRASDLDSVLRRQIRQLDP